MSQIGDVVNIDRMDSLDRQKLDPRVKLQLLCAEFKTTHGWDPRGGLRAVFVGRPRVILQLLLDITKLPGATNVIRLERQMIIGTHGADVVGFWEDVPIVVNSRVKDDNLYCVPGDKMIDSSQTDRQQAAKLRYAAHAGSLERLRE